MRVILLLESLPLMVKPHALPEQPSASHPSKSPLNPLYPNTYIHIVIHTHTHVYTYIYIRLATPLFLIAFLGHFWVLLAPPSFTTSSDRIALTQTDGEVIAIQLLKA